MEEVSRPTEVKVGPFVYRVYWTKAKWKEYKKQDKSIEAAGGAVFPNKHVILIRAWQQNEAVQRNVFIHELLHACFDLTQYSEHPFKNIKDVEEHTIQILTPVLHQVLLDNPKVVAWLLQ